MMFRLVVYVQLVLLFVQYASLQYNYNYNGYYNSNYNNPGYYQNAMPNYRYGYTTPQSNNDLTEEDARDGVFSVEIQRSSKHRKRGKKKDHMPKTYDNVYESDYNSPECKSGDDEESAECRECTCSECGPNDSNQNSCCPNYCDQCAATQSPGMPIMPYPMHFLMPMPMQMPMPMPMPMPYPTPGPDNCTTNTDDPSKSTTDTTDLTDTTEVTDTTETTDTTDTEETTHTTKTSSTPILTTISPMLMESTSTPKIFKSTTIASSTTTPFTAIAMRMRSSSSSPTLLKIDRIRQPVHFEQHPYPPPTSHRRPFSDQYDVSSNKRNKMHPMYGVQNNKAEDERDIRMIVLKNGRQHSNLVTYPPKSMLIRPHRDYVDEMQSRTRHDSKRYPTRRVSPHKIQKYGILPLPDKIATKLLLKLRTMKELTTKDKKFPQIRKLKQK